MNPDFNKLCPCVQDILISSMSLMWSQWQVWPWLVIITVDLEFRSVPWQLKLICLVDTGSDPCPKNEEKHWQNRHIPIGKVTAAIPQEKGVTLILLSEITLTAQDDSINISFNLDFYLQLTAGGRKGLDRSEMKDKGVKTGWTLGAFPLPS